jgi:hypothetical protein
MKYVITEHGQALVFDNSLRHDMFKHLNPVSAGSCTFHGDGVDVGFDPMEGVIVSVHGESTSLLLHSREEDAEIIKRSLRRYF